MPLRRGCLRRSVKRKGASKSGKRCSISLQHRFKNEQFIGQTGSELWLFSMKLRIKHNGMTCAVLVRVSMKVSFFQPKGRTSGFTAELSASCDRASRWNLIPFLVTVAVLVLAFNAQSASYYIDFASGSDANSGTSSNSPWKLAPGMNGFSGHYTHQSGDRFIFKGGVVWPNSMAPWIISNSGAPGNNDYYGVDKAWFSGSSWSRPVFNGGSQNPIPSSEMTGYLFIEGNYVTLDNLTVQNIGVSGKNQGNYAIKLSNCHDILVENMNLPVMSRVAILLVIASGTTVGNYEFVSNNISDCSWGIAGGPGAGTVMTNVLIHNNSFHDFYSQMDNYVHGDGVYLFSAVPNEDTYMDNVQIYNNVVYGNFASGDGTAGMSQFFWASAQMQGSAYIYNNVMTYSGGGTACAIGGSASSVANGSKGSVYVLNNTFYGDAKAGKFFSGAGLGNVVILNNVYYGGYGCYYFGAPLINLTSDYNDFNGSFLTASTFAFVTSYSAAKRSGSIASVSVTTPGTGYTVGSKVAPKYGIGGVLQVSSINSSGGVTGLSVVQGGFGYTGWPNSTTLLSGNGSGLTLTYSVTPSGLETHGITNDPLFLSANNLRLQAGSAAIGAGKNLTTFAIAHGLRLTNDPDGNPRPATGAWDMGAYQNSTDAMSGRPMPPTGLIIVGQ